MHGQRQRVAHALRPQTRQRALRGSDRGGRPGQRLHVKRQLHPLAPLPPKAEAVAEAKTATLPPGLRRSAAPSWFLSQKAPMTCLPLPLALPFPSLTPPLPDPRPQDPLALTRSVSSLADSLQRSVRGSHGEETPPLGDSCRAAAAAAATAAAAAASSRSAALPVPPWAPAPPPRPGGTGCGSGLGSVPSPPVSNWPCPALVWALGGLLSRAPDLAWP